MPGSPGRPVCLPTTSPALPPSRVPRTAKSPRPGPQQAVRVPRGPARPRRAGSASLGRPGEDGQAARGGGCVQRPWRGGRGSVRGQASRRGLTEAPEAAGRSERSVGADCTGHGRPEQKEPDSRSDAFALAAGGGGSTRRALRCPSGCAPSGVSPPSAPVCTGRRGFARPISVSVTVASLPLGGFCPNAEVDTNPQAHQERRALDASQAVTG